MRRIGIIMACGALAIGCDDGRGGGEDSGGIMLMDSGPEEDAGGNGGFDAGMMMATCSVAGAAGFPALPEPCLPRCSSATQMCIGACMDDPCAEACIDADTTPMTMIDFGMGMSDTLNCGDCVNWGINHCIFTSCPDQFGACIQNCPDFCNPMMAGCETEEMALDSCITANMTAIQMCAQTQIGRCF